AARNQPDYAHEIVAFWLLIHELLLGFRLTTTPNQRRHSMASREGPGSAVVTAMFCSGLVTAQFIAGKAARDALYLARLDVTSLPTMIIAASVFSIAVAAAFSKWTARLSPATMIPGAFVVSAVLLLVEWGLTSTAPKLAAIFVYLHISGILPVLGSGFWLLATEYFDPRTAKKRFGRIASAGTAGGILGGVVAER